MKVWPIPLAALLAFAGCLGASEESLPTNALPEAPQPRDLSRLPDPIEETGTVTAAADPLPFLLPEMACQLPTAKCLRYPFTLDNTTHVSISLSWGLAVNDFDLYLLEGGDIVATSGAAPPSTAEAIEDDFEAGDYEIVVLSWLVTTDTYTIKADFEAA